MRHFQIFDKIDSSLKYFSTVFDSKKGRLHLWRTSRNLHIIFRWHFFLSLWIPVENWAKLKKLFNLNGRLSWRAQYPRTTFIIFLSTIVLMKVNFWTQDNFCNIFDFRNSFNCKLKKLLNDQIIICYSPLNALCSSDESVQKKHFKQHTFIGIWFIGILVVVVVVVVVIIIIIIIIIVIKLQD